MNTLTIKRRFEQDIYATQNTELLNALEALNLGVEKRIANSVAKKELLNIANMLKNTKIRAEEVKGQFDETINRYIIFLGGVEPLTDFWDKNSVKEAYKNLLNRAKEIEKFAKGIKA